MVVPDSVSAVPLEVLAFAAGSGGVALAATACGPSSVSRHVVSPCYFHVSFAFSDILCGEILGT